MGASKAKRVIEFPVRHIGVCRSAEGATSQSIVFVQTRESMASWAPEYGKRQTKCMVDICGCFAIQAAGVMSAMR